MKLNQTTDLIYQVINTKVQNETQTNYWASCCCTCCCCSINLSLFGCPHKPYSGTRSAIHTCCCCSINLKILTKLKLHLYQLSHAYWLLLPTVTKDELKLRTDTKHPPRSETEKQFKGEPNCITEQKRPQAASRVRATQDPVEVASDHNQGYKGHDAGREYLPGLLEARPHHRQKRGQIYLQRGINDDVMRKNSGRSNFQAKKIAKGS